MQSIGGNHAGYLTNLVDLPVDQFRRRNGRMQPQFSGFEANDRHSRLKGNGEHSYGFTIDTPDIPGHLFQAHLFASFEEIGVTGPPIVIAWGNDLAGLSSPPQQRGRRTAGRQDGYTAHCCRAARRDCRSPQPVPGPLR